MTTLLLAFGLILIAAFLFAIGRLLTGKSKLHCKRCGTPEKKECSLCGKKKCDRKIK